MFVSPPVVLAGVDDDEKLIKCISQSTLGVLAVPPILKLVAKAAYAIDIETIKITKEKKQ